MSEPMRIHRALARAGVASRRAAEELVGAGRVTINGVVAKVGQSIDPARDTVLVDGRAVDVKAVTSAAATWMVLHKPSGVVTTKNDPQQRRTVFDLVPDTPGLTYVGRLDYLTEGVLLLTTDGDAAHKLTHPSTEVERVYEATVRGNVKEAADAARQGVMLDDGPAKPAWVQIRPLGDRKWTFEVGLREGRNREVRRICEAVGLEVERLVRTRFGPVNLGKLPPGGSRPLSERERLILESMVRGEEPGSGGGYPPPRSKRSRRG